MISCHSHSGQYCSHGHGTLRQVIDEATAQGFIIYALTEHMPRSREVDLYPEESHLNPSDTYNLYSNFHRQARIEQSIALSKTQTTSPTRICLLVGMEIEWIHENTFKEYQSLITEFPVDFVVGSVHHVAETPIDYSLDIFSSLYTRFNIQEIYGLYFDAQYDMLCKVRPLVVGHFDLVRIFVDEGFNGEVWMKIKRNIDFIVQNELLVEINSRGFKNCGFAYPFEDILTVMVEAGVRFATSDDAHGPKDVGFKYKDLFSYCHSVGIRKVYAPFRGNDHKIVIKELTLPCDG